MGKDKGNLVMANDANDPMAIRVQGVSKSFRLPHNRQNSIKGSLINLVSRGDRTYETQEVLKDVSFEVKKGEFFGIVGRNGSGKSTLLKMLAGIYTPTKGNIIINGSLTPFIELGVGFNPELTGRENVYLNGALLGFNDREVDAMYDDIVEFAELERFMDQKLKNYSSGMQVRLAFSIAIRAQSDILLLDEVLAVGDEAFQRKCYNYFETLKQNKKTVVLVTHDMAAVEKFCTTAMLIKDGQIIYKGNPRIAAQKYSNLNADNYKQEKQLVEEKKASRSTIKAEISSTVGESRRNFNYGETIKVQLKWGAEGVEHVGIALLRQSGEYIFGANTYRDGEKPLKGKKELVYNLALNVGPGDYFLKIALFNDGEQNTVDALDEGPFLIVEENDKTKKWGGLTKLDHSWGE